MHVNIENETMFPIVDKIFPLVVNNDYQGRVSVQGVKSLGGHFACLKVHYLKFGFIESLHNTAN